MVSMIGRAGVQCLPGIVLLTGLLGAGAVRAECACLCLDGTYQTVCNTLEEVRATQSSCQSQAGQGCPIAHNAPAPRRYGAPQDGADNCRDAAIYDPAEDRHRTVRVCDAAPDPG